MSRFHASLIVALLTLPAAAAVAQADEPFRCGTGDATERRVAALREHGARQQALSKTAGVPTARLRNGMFSMDANPVATPFYDPIDLVGSSIVFRRSGSSYSVERQALAYDTDTGSVLKRFRTTSGVWHYATYQLKNFAFPFFDKSVSTVYVSAFQGIFLMPPTPSPLEQIGTIDAIADTTPMIAPMLLTDAAPTAFIQPTVWVRDTAEAVLFTWRIDADPEQLDIQVKMSRDGDITFSYRAVGDISWGAVNVTSGQEEWRKAATTIGSGSDPAGDAQSSFGSTVKPMLDIRDVEVVRKGSFDILEVRIRTGTVVEPKLASSNDALQYFVTFDSDPRRLFSGGLYYELPANGTPAYYVGGNGGGPSPAARIEGDTVVLQFAESSLPLAAEQRIWLYTSAWSHPNFADSATFSFTIPPATRPAELDLSAIAQPVTGERPLTEVFTLPALNPYGVWDQLKAQYPSLREDDVDALAIYQTFYTDIIFYAGAYSTGGNAGVDGLAPRNEHPGAADPREPSLLHMNRFDYGVNSTLLRSGHVSLHEFGHRWLFFARIREEGEITDSLNPISAHPAQYVHTPAAFPVYGNFDSSVMGGAYFTDYGDGRFQSGSYASYGYSWLDLYLMGLAAPEEVPPFFYIRDSGLGGAYYPPPDRIVEGVRKDVTLAQVVEGSGIRNPSAAAAQRTFKVHFVLLTRPGETPTEDDMQRMEDHRRTFVEMFRRATGHRGEVITSFVVPESGPRRRTVRRQR